jgi:hypothetical protein
MSKSLLALSDESQSIRKQLEAMVDQETGEIPDSAIDLMMSNQLAITDKLNGYLDFMSEIKQTVEICKDKVKTFNAKIKQIKSVEDRMRENIRKYMSDNNIKKIEADKTISLVSEKNKIEYDIDTMPPTYLKTKTTVEIIPDDEAIAKALSEGIEIPGVTVIENRTSIRIR